MDIKTLQRSLDRYADPTYLDQMKLLGVNTEQAIGVRMPKLKMLAKSIGKDHDFAQKVWALEHHEGRILAGLIEEPDQVDRKQADEWVESLQSWDEVDQMCGYLFQKLPFVEDLIEDWVDREEAFIRRAGFVLIVATCIHHKDKEDDFFHQYFDTIHKHAKDDRNFVKKAVNWALRQLGKRSIHLNKEALKHANQLKNSKNPTAQWIGKDAIKELKNEEVLERLNKKEEKRLKKLEKKRKKEQERLEAEKKKAEKEKEKEKAKKKKSAKSSPSKTSGKKSSGKSKKKSSPKKKGTSNKKRTAKKK